MNNKTKGILLIAPFAILVVFGVVTNLDILSLVILDLISTLAIIPLAVIVGLLE